MVPAGTYPNCLYVYVHVFKNNRSIIKYSRPTVDIINGDCIHILKGLGFWFVVSVKTSPHQKYEYHQIFKT